jgi:WD40 repeat protein
LLFDFSFLEAKLKATNVNALIADCEPFVGEIEPRLVRDSIRLSAHVLSKDSRQLATQLLGRLLGRNGPGICHLIEEAKSWRGGVWLRPLTPNLNPPGGPLIRTLKGHTDYVSAVAVVGNGRLVSGSADATLRLWDLESGETLRTFEGHTDGVTAVVAVDGRRAVSGSLDCTLRLWDLETGDQLRSLHLHHQDRVTALAVLDGRRTVFGSEGRSLGIWDIETGEESYTQKAHRAEITAVNVVDDRCAVSGSKDSTVRVWDLQSGKPIRTLLGHCRWITTVALAWIPMV